MNYILGVSGYFHDSSVCLLRDGRLIEFVKEESLTRIKGTRGFPSRSLKFLIKKYNLADNNIDYLAFYEKPLRGWATNTHFSLAKPKTSFDLLRHQIKQFWTGPIHFVSELKKILRISEHKLLFVPHHLSHALSAFAFVNPAAQEKPSLNFVFDGVGDGNTTSIFEIKNKEAKLVFQQNYPHSLGLFYSAVTDYCGFLVNEGEYKLMALAAFGSPKYFDFLKENVFNIDAPSFTLDMSWFDYDKSPERSYSDKWVKRFGPPIHKKEINDLKSEGFIRAADLACSSQLILEEVINATIIWGIGKTGIRDLTISGGVAQNSLAMCSAGEINEVNSLTIPPSPGDSGAAIGAANFAQMLMDGRGIACKDIFFGDSQVNNKKAIFAELFAKEADVRTTNERFDNLINSGEIVACYFGGNEIGPRALCNRSLVCSANNKETVLALNSIVKKREKFRPLAPVMLRSVAEKWFKINPKVSDCYQWMAITAVAREELPIEYEPILHFDRTARIQIIEDRRHPIYAFLTRNQGKIDMLVNTSFNVAGDPIVFDEFDCFVNMKRLGITYMVTDTGLYSCK